MTSPLAKGSREELLDAWGLMEGERSIAEASLPLVALCDRQRLRGGLSAALDVGPDQLLGPLLSRISEPVPRLKVLDVLGAGPMTLRLQWKEEELRWELEEVADLVHQLNALFQDQPQLRAVVDLGEIDEMRQFWCVDKSLLAKLLGQPWFAVSNRAQLDRLCQGETFT